MVKPLSAAFLFGTVGTLFAQNAGFIEAESLIENPGKARVQAMKNFGAGWSGNAHLLWDGLIGNATSIRFTVPTTGEFSLQMQFTKAPDYGIFQVSLDGKPIGKPVDLYDGGVVLPPITDFGKVPLTEGDHTVTFKLTGAHPKSRAFRKPNTYLLGLDYIKVLAPGMEPKPLPNPVLKTVPPLDFKSAQPVLATHCFSCHGDKPKVKGKVNLKKVTSKQGFLDNIELAQKVLDALTDHEMPPEEEKQPTRVERTQLTRLFHATIQEYLKSNASIEPVTMRRMNRYEYNNSVKQLLNMKTDLFPLPEKPIRAYGNYFFPDRGRLPEQMKVGNRSIGKNQMEKPILKGVTPFAMDLQAEHGFNNQGDLLSVSPILLESFLHLGQKIVNAPEFPSLCGSYKELFEPADSAEPRIRRLMHQAFREPPEAETVQRYIALFEAQSKQSDFTEAMKKVVSALISSPKFLYLIEDKSDAGKVNTVNDYELATRLSFFLWSSIPDQTLLDLASKNQLHEPDVLEFQVKRMLLDPKSKALSESFARQWLQLDRLIFAQPDPDRYPTFYSRIGCEYWGMGIHMMLEPLLLFESIMVEDRSILELVHSEHTYRSGELNTWYSDPNPFGKKGERGRFGTHNHDFRRMAVTNDRQGGVLFTAATMTMTSSPLRTQPITRGAWVATVLFNDPPDPPPDDVPEIEEDDKVLAKQGLTLRKWLEEHRSNPNCVSCHQKIDPLGFALENYDSVGRWREQYHSGLAIDSSGALWGAQAFTDISEFKKTLLADPDRFVRAFSEHLLSYALGRELHVSDTAAVEKILNEVNDNDLRFSSVVHAVIQSFPFHHKTNQLD